MSAEPAARLSILIMVTVEKYEQARTEPLQNSELSKSKV